MPPRPATADRVFKILEDDPHAVVPEHWIRESDTSTIYLCPEYDCPLCNVGHQRRIFGYFNIVDLNNLRDPSKPVVRPWKCSETRLDELDRLQSQGRLDAADTYFVLRWRGGISRISGEELQRNWHVVPLDPDVLAYFRSLAVEKAFHYPAKARLEEAAASLRP